jgi:hypothetical protein
MVGKRLKCVQFDRRSNIPSSCQHPFDNFNLPACSAEFAIQHERPNDAITL